MGLLLVLKPVNIRLITPLFDIQIDRIIDIYFALSKLLRILTLFTGKRLHYYSQAGVLYLRRAYSRSKSLVY